MRQSRVLDEEGIRAIARLAGLTVPDADLPALIRALAGYVAALPVLDERDLDTATMAATFDPRWP